MAEFGLECFSKIGVLTFSSQNRFYKLHSYVDVYLPYCDWWAIPTINVSIPGITPGGEWVVNGLPIYANTTITTNNLSIRAWSSGKWVRLYIYRS